MDADANDVVLHLNAISPLLSRLSSGRKEVSDELRQRVAVELLLRQTESKPINRGICIAIARHEHHDMLAELRRRAERFRPYSEINDRQSHAKSVFDNVWDSLSCEPLRERVRSWRKVLAVQERRALRRLRKGATQAQVAALENVPLGTVGSWSSRARKKLEAMLAD